VITSEVQTIDYDHSRNGHTLNGPQAALPLFFAHEKPKSLLDVGCGTGTWMRAAQDLGVTDIFGIDGVEVPTDQLNVPKQLIRLCNLSLPWNLDRRFEVVLCLEVAEHLDASPAETLIDGLVRHGNTIYFSAACPGQIGQHHVNCQWPAYWQQLFNGRGYVCEDSLRWQIWDDERIEPWYRQNLFVARQAPRDAGHEPRIKGVVHPGIFLGTTSVFQARIESLGLINRGISLIRPIVPGPIRTVAAKVKRHLKKETP